MTWGAGTMRVPPPIITDFPMVNDETLSDTEASESESSDGDPDFETDGSYHPDTDSDSYDSETESGSTSATDKFETEAALVTRDQST